jgi:D-serine deaminase-like pyridoxal phosphate-dependent protein
MENWFEVENTDCIDSPALLIYPDRVTDNIRQLKKMVAGDTSRLRPHAKTHKMVEVSKMLIEEGIDQFKCSTIAEAEMLAMSNAKDVLLAYQPVGPKLQRWVKLIQEYPNTHFACIVDHPSSIKNLAELAKELSIELYIYFDINVGMGRTGASQNQIDGLWESLQNYPNLHLEGVHGYDGHIHDPDLKIREKESDACYKILKEVFDKLQVRSKNTLKMVIGGSPSFTTHSNRKDVVCSPGTFVFWDWGYRQKIPEQKFEYAAVLLTRVISIINETRICIDLGYKAVASDPPLPRVKFLNADDAIPAFQSEEHLVLDVNDSKDYPLGKILYAVPTHVCPTVALYDRVSVIKDHQKIATWQVMGRSRMLNI